MESKFNDKTKQGFDNSAFEIDIDSERKEKKHHAAEDGPEKQSKLGDRTHETGNELNSTDLNTDYTLNRRKRRKDRKSNGDEKKRKGSLAGVKGRFEKCTNYMMGIFVRLLLIGGNVLAAWRTVVELDDTKHWLLVPVCAVLMMIEYSIVICKMKGLEWTWWSPCFLVYLGTTFPLVWQMQIRQHDNYVAKLNSVAETYSDTGVLAPQSLVDNSSSITTSTASSVVQLQDISWRTILNISNDTWVIVVNESLVYLVIFSRWLLPRGEISREFLADMLLEFLAIASDIMELLALFDEGKVRENIMLNYWILTAWSVSFIQFIPVLIHKRKYRRIQSSNVSCLRKACGTSCTEVLATIMNIVLQDGSFLVLRLYIMIHLNFVTYSLTFFVMKNLLSILLLLYRLIILIHNLPCCCGSKYQLSNSLRRTRTVSYE